MEMHSTPSPCCTPIVIYSSSDDESADHGCFADDDSHFLVHATPIPSECSSSSIFSTAGVGDLTDNSNSECLALLVQLIYCVLILATRLLSLSLFLTEVTSLLALVMAHQKT